MKRQKKKKLESMACPIKSMEFTYQGKKYRRCGVNLENNTEKVKNLESGNYADMDWNQLQTILKNAT